MKQLVAAGLIHRQTEGRQVYYSANRESPIFPELQGIIQKTAGAAAALGTALGPLLRKRRVAVAFLYGSVATGSQRAGSDVDLLIIGDVTLSDVIPAVRTAEKRLGREVNPSVYPVKEFRRKLKTGSSFLKRVIAGPKLFIAGDERELERLAG